ncbi:ATP phosphoribosyltransferase [Candidatus Peregrinibacteria bacterium]|nr:ATP phosphoribosyltransferase [Candidatus Peregrinibacteria bacterium]MBT7703290.1 ATP phosphoribosyltransferase [Candidatus Peregrinibacteria bacterium]
MKKFNNGRLKIGIQKNGRLTEQTIDLLKRSGFEFDAYGRRLFSTCRNFPLEILFLRDDDIPEYVQDSVCDLGIVGENVVKEKMAKVEVVEKLGFGMCRICLAVPRNSGIEKIKELNGKRIATSYPNVLEQFLEKKRVISEIVEVSGAVEITPSLQVAEAICDVVSTGTTLRTNGLRVLDEVLESEALLIGNLKSMNKQQKILERFLMRLRGTLVARKNRYVMMNAPKSSLEKIRKILPGLSSPTVLPLAEQDMIAVHSVVPEQVFWEVMERLKEAGASGILVTPIEKMIL